MGTSRIERWDWIGLDWQPLGRPKPGDEAEYAALYEKVVLFGDRNKSRLKRWSEIQISPYETLGAPRVGVNVDADRWVAEQYPNRPRELSSLSQSEFVARFHGLYVLEILPESDGLPTYSDGGFGSYCEAFTFRAKFLEGCEDVLGEELLTEAWGHHTAAETHGLRQAARRGGKSIRRQAPSGQCSRQATSA